MHPQGPPILPAWDGSGQFEAPLACHPCRKNPLSQRCSKVEGKRLGLLCRWGGGREAGGPPGLSQGQQSLRRVRGPPVVLLKALQGPGCLPRVQRMQQGGGGGRFCPGHWLFTPGILPRPAYLHPTTTGHQAAGPALLPQPCGSQTAAYTSPLDMRPGSEVLRTPGQENVCKCAVLGPRDPDVPVQNTVRVLLLRGRDWPPPCTLCLCVCVCLCAMGPSRPGARRR